MRYIVALLSTQRVYLLAFAQEVIGAKEARNLGLLFERKLSKRLKLIKGRALSLPTNNSERVQENEKDSVSSINSIFEV